VTQSKNLDGLRDLVLDAFGAVDLVMNNAGAGACGRVWELPDETWRSVVDVNVLGVVNGLRSFVPLLVAQNRGHVVNTASMAGLVPVPVWSPYVATKFAVVGLTECLFHELASVAPGVGVSLLCPGPVATDFLNPNRVVPQLPGGEADDEIAQVASRAHQLTLEHGIAPSDVAEHVFEAVRDRRFYVLTHPPRAVDVARRAEDIVQGRLPTLA
jgi:short-subunit dehydrogenase